MQTAAGVKMLELAAVPMGRQQAVNPTLIWDKAEAVLVDTGLPGQLPQIRLAMEEAGVPLEKLTRIIITHHDIDHLGNLAALVRESARPIEVLAHGEERPYIEGERRPIKLTPERMAQMEAQMAGLPEDQRRAIKFMNESFHLLAAKISRAIGDAEVLPYAGGLTVIHTPGHTPGHLCLYHQSSRTLIAGDALFVEQGKLCPAPALTNHDTGLALASLRKLTGFDVARVICYHGGLYQEDGVNVSIAGLAAIAR